MVWVKDLTYWDSFKLILVGFMGNNVLPARMGEVLRAHCAADKINNTNGRTATLASIVIERVLDGFVLAIGGILGLFIVHVDGRLFMALMAVCILFFVLTAGLLVSIFYNETIRNIMTTINRIFPGYMTIFSKEKAYYFLDGLLLLRGCGRMCKAVLLTELIWCIELSMYYVIANGVSHNISVGQCLVFLVSVNFASLFPLTIGGLGAIEGVATIYLISTGIPPDDSFAMVLVQHGYQFFFTTFLGAYFYFTNRYFNIPIFRNGERIAPVSGYKADKKSTLIGEIRTHLDEASSEIRIQGRPARNVQLSIVIPTFNEQNRLPKTILESIAWCNRNCPSYELIIADNGSSDDTLVMAGLFSDYDASVRVLRCPHPGKGSAVRFGMLNASGDYILFMDADGATPLSEIPKLQAKIDAGYSIAIGSRVAQYPVETTVKTSFHRKLIGRTFAAVVNIFAISGIADTQCGFKMFRKDAAKELFSRQKFQGFAFDVEILFLARKLLFSIAEVPVSWNNQKGSKVNLVTDSFKMLKDIAMIRILHRKSFLPCDELIRE
jgi:dolichyl-phosphate beta-glucosyltransferase